MKSRVNETIWDLRNCPSCGISSTGRPEVSSAIPAESLTFDEVKDYFIGIRSEQVFFSYTRCANCGLLYCPYYFNENQLDLLYADMPDNLLGAEKSTAAKTQIGYFKWFSKFVEEVDGYQELGPDIGLVTEAVLGHYTPTRVILVEPNSAMHGLLSSLKKPESELYLYRDLNEVPFDQITLTIGVHVFDHLLNPSAQLSFLAKQTSPKGYVGIVVHNEKSLLKKLLGTKWPPFCLQHPQLFNQKTLTRLMENHGFHQIKISKSINHFNLKHIGSMGIDLLGWPTFLKRFFPEIEVPISLGNQISIFRKN